VARKAKDTSGAENGPEGETVAGYFRAFFKENPQLLWERSNEEPFNCWLRDHPGHNEVPQHVKTGLQNIKSALRQKSHKKKAKKQTQSNEPAQARPSQPAPQRTSARGLNALEDQIDECLTSAKNLDREGLREVIGLLREARDRVVCKIGEP
jgi:hypothetical protein